MKTSKLVMIASILAIAVMSLSFSQSLNAGEDLKDRSARKVSHMTFEQAIQNAGILEAMYDQIEYNILPHNWPYYTARIQYRGTNIYIQGSYEQWYYFFEDQIIYQKTHRQ